MRGARSLARVVTRSLRRASRDERGVSAVVLTLCVCLVIVPLGAVAVDLGVKRVASQDMQAVADVVALDLARDLDPTKKASQYNLTTMATKAKDRAGRQANIGSNTRFLVQVGRLDQANYGSSGYFTPLTGNEIPTAVRVFATTDVSFTLARALPKGGISGSSATRAAVATLQKPSVCFSAGTDWLTFNSSKTAIGPLLDNIIKVNLKGAGYEGIFNLKSVEIPLADLALALNAGSPDSAFDTNITIGQFLLASATVLQKNNIAQATILQGMTFGLPGASFKIADFLALGAGTSASGANASVNMLDLLSTALVVANGTNSIVGNVTNIVGVTSVKITEPPQLSCDPSKPAEAAQFEFRITRQFPKIVDGITLGLASDQNKVDIVFTSGEGSVSVVGEPSCTTPGSVTVHARTAGMAARAAVTLYLSLGRFMDIIDIIPGVNFVMRTALSILLGGDAIKIIARLSGGLGTAEESAVISIPAPPAKPAPITLPSHQTDSIVLGYDPAYQPALSVETGGVLGIFGGLATLVVNTLVGGLSGTLGLISQLVITPVMNEILSLLGTSYGTVDVKLEGDPVCRGVKLVG